MSNDNMATGHNLDTSEGARAYVAEYFANHVGRHDFRAYITTRLAADFACALAQHLAARQPVAQKPALFVNRWEMEHGAAPGLVAMRAGRHLGIREFFTVPLYTAPPAQAVDLGPVRELLQRRMAQWRSHLPDDPNAPGTRLIQTDGEDDYINDVRIYREGIAVMDEALALIDSKAVGNG